MKYTAPTPKLDRIDLTQTGIAMFLGPRSADIMCLLWQEPATTKNVWKRLRASDTMYTTVATTMNRLVERGFLTRENIGTDTKPTYHFTPTMSELELTHFCINYTLLAIRLTFNINFVILGENDAT